MQILHLEYSAFFRQIIHDMLVEAGFNPISMKNGKDIYKILATEDIDVVITGLELADMTGEELIDDLRNSKFGDLPIIVISGSEISEIRQRLKGLFIDDFIVKTELTQERLVDSLERVSK